MIVATISQLDIDRIKAKLERVRPDKRGAVLYNGMRTAGLLVERELKLEVSGKSLKVRSGRLRNSIGSRVVYSGNILATKIGSGAGIGKQRVKYANIHEKGGVVRPTHGQFLAIPLDRTAGGDTRGVSPRQMKNTFVRGNIIYQNVNGKAVAKFVLKRQVTIPASRYMEKALKRAQRGAISALLKSITVGLSK